MKIAWEPHWGKLMFKSFTALEMCVNMPRFQGSLANCKQVWTKNTKREREREREMERDRHNLYERRVPNLYFKVPCWMLGCDSPETCRFRRHHPSTPRCTPTCGPEKSTRLNGFSVYLCNLTNLPSSYEKTPPKPNYGLIGNFHITRRLGPYAGCLLLGGRDHFSRTHANSPFHYGHPRFSQAQKRQKKRIEIHSRSVWELLYHAILVFHVWVLWPFHTKPQQSFLWGQRMWWTSPCIATLAVSVCVNVGCISMHIGVSDLPWPSMIQSIQRRGYAAWRIQLVTLG